MSIKVKSTNPPYNNYHHFHASPKYRAAVFTRAMEARMDKLINDKCQELVWWFSGLAVDEDHIHFLVRAETTYSNVAQRIFGYTSRILRQEFPQLKDLNQDHLWGGKQYIPVNDENHLQNLIAYIGKHKRTDLP